jgi:SAM-dependent methyltransferase
MSERLNVYDGVWDLDAVTCPCDLDFLDYLDACDFRKGTVFHFGSGAHHVVGREIARRCPDIDVLSITASQGEYQRYMDMIVANPRAANSYKALFADIYTLSAAMLPMFDYVTLFHLCEFYSERANHYARLNDDSLLELFVDRLKPRGRILFYARSKDFAGAELVIDRAVQRGRIRLVEHFKSLLVYDVPGSSGSEVIRAAHSGH